MKSTCINDLENNYSDEGQGYILAKLNSVQHNGEVVAQSVGKRRVLSSSSSTSADKTGRRCQNIFRALLR